MSNIRQSRLPNGICVLTESLTHARGVGIAVVADAGPQDEPVQAAGLAHLCEHSFFLGTATRTENEISELIDSAGGQLGGFTARDYTCLHATVSGDYVTYAIDLLGDMMSSGTFSEERLKREIEVIRHEIDAHQDSPENWLDSELKRCMWGNDPIGRSLLGTHDSLSAIQRDDVLGFIRHQYTPDRLIVSAVGNIDHDDFVEQTHDATWQLSGHDHRRKLEPAKPIGGILTYPGSQRMVSISLMIPAPVYTDSDRFALHVLVAMLGGGMSSRLYRDLRERQGLAYSISAQLHAYGRGGILVIEWSTSPDAVLPSIVAVLNQLTQLAWSETPIGEEELWKAKMQVRGQAYLASDSIQTRVSRLATQQLYFGEPVDDLALLNSIDAVDMPTVCEVASRVLHQGLTTMTIGVTGGLPMSPESLRDEISALRDCFVLTTEESPQIAT